MTYNLRSSVSISVRVIISMVILVTLLTLLPSCADNSNVQSELVLSEYTGDNNEAIRHLRFEVITDEPTIRVFECFDVSKERNVAIGYSCTNPGDPDLKNVVAVYSSNNDFLYGFTFYTRGVFHVMFDSDGLVILCRSGMKAIFLNPNGEINYIKSIVDVPESKAFLDGLYSNVRNVGNYKYTADYIPSTYTTLRMDDGHNEVVLYDASDRFIWDAYYIWLVPLVFLICVLVIAIRSLINKLKG